MGKNKLQKFAAIACYPHVFEYPFAVLKTEGFPLKGTWGKTFFKNNNPIVLELGCGKGEYAVGMARQYKDKNFIGVDIKGARIWSGAKTAIEDNLANVAFLRTDIELIHHFFAAGEISEIWITFPDPQMRKVRKRLTSTRFMAYYNSILANNGVIHLKTDSMFLYSYTLAMVQTNQFPIVVNSDNLYHSGIVDPILNIKTFYEQQWLERGIDIKYLQWKLEQKESYIEPEEEIEYDSYRSFNRSKRSGKSTNIE